MLNNIKYIFSHCAGDDSGKVTIWNMAPVKNEEDEMNENVPKLLCQMDNHFGGFDAIFYLSVEMFSCSSTSMFKSDHIILIIMMIIKMMMTMMMMIMIMQLVTRKKSKL